MRKKIRLTESELIRVIENTLKEEMEDHVESDSANRKRGKRKNPRGRGPKMRM